MIAVQSVLKRKFRSALWHVERYVKYFWWQWSPVLRRGKAHDLDRSLIVSLTSYPARYKTLPLTLKCLLSQTVRPDEVALWIAHEDRDLLTKEIKSLQRFGLTIRFCSDLRSFKKIIPALRTYPDCFIVTADDDICYPRKWLEKLVSEYTGNRAEVLCHRAHKIRFGVDGLPLPYGEWEFQSAGTARAPLIFPTGCGGVLYPPGIFDARVTDETTFSGLCPTADDVWLYWMVRLNGGTARLIGNSRVMDWPVPQSNTLSPKNLESGNDCAVARMIEHFGFPPLSRRAIEDN